MRLAAGRQAEVLNSIVLPALSPATLDATSAVSRYEEGTAGSAAERDGWARERPSGSVIQGGGGGGGGGGREEPCESDGAWRDQTSVSASVAVMEHERQQLQQTSLGVMSVQQQQVWERQVMEVGEREAAVSKAWSRVPLKERIGHTKVEVAVGAVSGLVTSLLVHLMAFSQ